MGKEETLEHPRRVAASLEAALGAEGSGGLCLTSAVADSGARAVACYREDASSSYWVAYMEDPARLEDAGAPTGARPSSVDGGGGETLAVPDGYELRYLRGFRGEQAGFRAGVEYGFFAENLASAPTETPPDEELLADHERGARRIEEKIKRRRLRTLYDEMLAAEEAGAKAQDAISSPEPWLAISDAAALEISRLEPDPEKRARDLRFHRFRRAASRGHDDDDGARGEGA